MTLPIQLTVNGALRCLDLDPRLSLLDTLRDELGVMSVKKGCDHGQCGACTVLLDGRRVLACLCLAVSHDGASIVTAEGLGQVGRLHPMQQAFIDHDGLQCGYCTPGQVCSAVGMLAEFAAGQPSHVTAEVIADVTADITSDTGEVGHQSTPLLLTDDEIRERMSGNLCRCGAYVNIVAAIREVARAAPALPTADPAPAEASA